MYLKGHSSTASDAIWPLAILDHPEKRGPLRKLTQGLRIALNHVQEHGLHLHRDYTDILRSFTSPTNPTPPSTDTTPSPPKPTPDTSSPTSHTSQPSTPLTSPTTPLAETSTTGTTTRRTAILPAVPTTDDELTERFISALKFKQERREEWSKLRLKRRLAASKGDYRPRKRDEDDDDDPENPFPDFLPDYDTDDEDEHAHEHHGACAIEEKDCDDTDYEGFDCDDRNCPCSGPAAPPPKDPVSDCSNLTSHPTSNIHVLSCPDLLFMTSK